MNISATVINVGEYAFSNAKGLLSVRFEEGSKLTEINTGVSALISHVTSLCTLHILIHSIIYVASFHMQTFEACAKLGTIHIIATMTEIKENAFTGSGLKNVNFTKAVKLKTLSAGVSGLKTCVPSSYLLVFVCTGFLNSKLMWLFPGIFS